MKEYSYNALIFFQKPYLDNGAARHFAIRPSGKVDICPYTSRVHGECNFLGIVVFTPTTLYPFFDRICRNLPHACDENEKHILSTGVFNPSSRV